MNTFLSTKNDKECCGCMSCVYSCPTGAIILQNRFDEFSYPQIDASKCINCGKCEKVCPNDTVSDLVSPIIKTFALKHKDIDTRKHSSSGGAFTAISDLLMNEGYKVYGAVFTGDYLYVNHIGSYEKSDRNRMRISKYVESNLKDIYPAVKKDLENNEKVFFTGTPCQSTGLRAFLGKKYDNLFVMDFVCHGVLSPKLMHDYTNWLANESKINEFSYRDNINNTWENSQTPYIDCEDKSHLSYLPYCYNLIFRSIGLRASCGVCKYAQPKRSSDITVGDLWPVDWLCPEIKDDFGVSFIAANSERGYDVIKRLNNTCNIIELEKSKAVAAMGQLNYPTSDSLINGMFWKYYKKHSVKQTFEIYGGDSLYSKLRRKPFEIALTKLKK